MKEREVHAFCFFADLRGFGGFLRRSSHAESEVLPFWRNWRKLVNDFEKKTGYWVKRVGDGIFVVVEVDPNDAPIVAAQVLNEIWLFLASCKAMIDQKPSPRPDGIRVAGVYGVVWREPSIQFKHDYFGDKINLCERMTRQWKGKCCVIHESWKELLTREHCRRNGFAFIRLGKDPEVEVPPIYARDMEGNWNFIKRKRK